MSTDVRVEYGAAGEAPGIVSRPVLHPVHTPAGALVTGAEPADHPWHRGIGLGLPDVDGINLWGGPSYVAGHGYDPARTRLGQVTSQPTRTDSVIEDRVGWCDPDGAVLLTEDRRITLDQRDGVLVVGWSSILHATRALTLGSPASSGRSGAAYGGFFWRLPVLDPTLVEVVGPDARGEEGLNGRRAPSLGIAVAGEHPWRARITPTDARTAADPWFVRVQEYVGIGSSLAAERPLRLVAGERLAIGLRIELEDR